MLFSYDFGHKLDLTKFKKQAPHYIANMREVNYNLFLQDYKVVVEIATPDVCNGHIVSVHFSSLKRDQDGDIIDETIIVPLLDTRFKEIQYIKDIFKINSYKAYFDSNSVVDTVDKICMLLRLVYKINNLKAFI